MSRQEELDRDGAVSNTTKNGLSSNRPPSTLHQSVPSVSAQPPSASVVSGMSSAVPGLASSVGSLPANGPVDTSK